MSDTIELARAIFEKQLLDCELMIGSFYIIAMVSILSRYNDAL